MRDFCYIRQAKPSRRLSARYARAGYSMTEMIWVVALLGIIATMAIAHVNQSLFGSRLIAAQHKAEMLNQALHAYARAQKEITEGDAAPGGGTNDENLILLTLQYGDDSRPGSPYLAPTYRPKASGSSEDYRLRWTGRLFEVLEPGQGGAGLKVDFEGGDFGSPFVYPPNFRPLGR